MKKFFTIVKIIQFVASVATPVLDLFETIQKEFNDKFKKDKEVKDVNDSNNSK